MKEDEKVYFKEEKLISPDKKLKTRNNTYISFI